MDIDVGVVWIKYFSVLDFVNNNDKDATKILLQRQWMLIHTIDTNQSSCLIYGFVDLNSDFSNNL